MDADAVVQRMADAIDDDDFDEYEKAISDYADLIFQGGHPASEEIISGMHKAIDRFWERKNNG